MGLVSMLSGTLHALFRLGWVRAFGLAAVASIALVVLPDSTRADGPGLFSGPYIGVSAGAAWGRARFATKPNCPATADATFCTDSPDPSVANGTAVAASGTGNITPIGFTGGLQAGYNWQAGTLVYGAEADFGDLGLAESSSAHGFFPVTFLGDQYTLTQAIMGDWLATIRARLGFACTPHVLFYATGGLAFSGFRFSSSYSDNAISSTFPGGTGSGTRSEIRTGWAAGGGAEWLLRENWSIKAEYLYVDLGSMRVPVPTSNTAAFTQTMQVDVDLTVQIARLGLNYKF